MTQTSCLTASVVLAESVTMKSVRLSELMLAATLSVLLVGCSGSGGPFDYVPVTGKVTYDDGTLIPVSGMKIYFHSLEPPKDGMHVRPGIGSVGPDGTFKDITSYKYADGLIRGKYKVSLVSGEPGKKAPKIPKECALPDKTPLRVDVTESGQFLEIKVPKP